MNTVDFRSCLYKSYVTSHIAHRKGAQTEKTLATYARIFNQHFGRLLPTDRNARIIDLGCGSGSLIYWLKQRGYTNVSGVDASEEQVEVAHQSGLTEVSLGDVFGALKPGENYDLIFARDLVEHFDRQTIFRFLECCKASLRPSGSIILQVPNAESPFFGRIRYGDFTHEIAFTRSSATQILTALGYTDVAILPWRPPITNWKSFIRHAAWRLIEPLLILPMSIETGGRGRIVTINLIIKSKVSAKS